jgi:bifunctional DNA-binding transcriptional regulator/antitoxin component of YhaV-PrlF toxin-antitoxin module
MEAVVSPEGQLVISAAVTSALDLKAGDRVSVTVEEKGLWVEPRTKSGSASAHVSPTASLEEKRAFYSSAEFVAAASEHFRKARAAVARDQAVDR